MRLAMPSAGPCPACHNHEHQFLYEKSGCRVERCTTCGLGRTLQVGFEPADYYTGAYFDGRRSDGYADYAGSEPVLLLEFRGIVGELRRLMPSGRILEIGCAYGFFLTEARKYYDVHGVEIADEAAAFARARGLDVRTGILSRELLEEIGPLDAVVMLDVSEHLEQPHAVLKLCAEYIRPGGVVILSTGDFGSSFAQLTGKRWRLMTPPQHLWFFTRHSIEGIASDAGLHIERFCHPWKRVPLSLILYQLGRFTGVRLPAKAISWASCLGLRVNLFDMMRVTLRR